MQITYSRFILQRPEYVFLKIFFFLSKEENITFAYNRSIYCFHNLWTRWWNLVYSDCLRIWKSHL